MSELVGRSSATGTRATVSDSLWAASAKAAELPAGLIEDAQIAFMAGFNGAAVFSAFSVAVLVLLAAVALRHVRPIGQSDETKVFVAKPR